MKEKEVETEKSNEPSIAELAHRCSESAREFVEEMIADLDRRAGAALAWIEAARRARLSPTAQLSSPADDTQGSQVASASPESNEERR
jgi:hypothetical protein